MVERKDKILGFDLACFNWLVTSEKKKGFTGKSDLGKNAFLYQPL